MGDLDKDRNLNVNIEKDRLKRVSSDKGLSCKSWPSATTI